MKGFKGIVLLSALALLAMPVGKVQANTQDDILALQSAVAALQMTVTAQQTTIEELQTQLTVLNNNDAVKIGALGYMKFDTSSLNNVVGPHVVFDGVNVHVRDGSDYTGGSPSGLGNLIIGYNGYNSDTGGGQNEGDRAGKHNLIMGEGHIFKGYGNFAQGWGASLLGNNSAAIASDTNTLGSYSASLAGQFNTLGNSSVAVSGDNNSVTGPAIAVSGSHNILSAAQNSAILGGRNNTIGGDPFVNGFTFNAIILGGENNTIENAQVGGNSEAYSTSGAGAPTSRDSLSATAAFLNHLSELLTRPGPLDKVNLNTSATHSSPPPCTTT